jgi:hypothetical protein
MTAKTKIAPCLWFDKIDIATIEAARAGQARAVR